MGYPLSSRSSFTPLLFYSQGGPANFFFHPPLTFDFFFGILWIMEILTIFLFNVYSSIMKKSYLHNIPKRLKSQGFVARVRWG